MGLEKFQAIGVELDGAPGMGVEKIIEIVAQLLRGELLDAVVEIAADTANRPGIGLGGLRLQSLEPEVLEMGLVMALESLLG
jgi:hypothetical protein